MTEWQKVKLGDICDVRDGTHDSPKQSLEGKFLVTSKHIKGGKIDLSSAYKISLEDFNFVNQRSKVEQWDILISMIGTVGEICLICTPPDFAIKNVGLIKAGNKDLAQYLFYYLKSPISQNDIETRLKGTTQQYLSLSEIRDFPVFLPPLEIQRKIAGILGALDDRIDVLRRENVVLEQMAQAVFQSWFVDFDIVRAKAAGTPESEVCEKYHISPELYALFPSALTPDDLPLGWEKLPFSETMKIVSGGTPKTTEADFWNGNIPWYSVVDAPASVYVLDTEKHITQQGLENSPCSLLKKDTVIISARGTVGKLAMVGKEMAMNQSCYGLEFDFPYYGYLTTRQMLVYLRQNVHGAVFDTITKDTFKTVETVNVPRALQENFTKLVSSFFEKIYKNAQQIRALSATRDALLPKLMNGEIEV